MYGMSHPFVVFIGITCKFEEENMVQSGEWGNAP